MTAARLVSVSAAPAPLQETAPQATSSAASSAAAGAGAAGASRVGTAAQTREKWLWELSRLLAPEVQLLLLAQLSHCCLLTSDTLSALLLEEWLAAAVKPSPCNVMPLLRCRYPVASLCTADSIHQRLLVHEHGAHVHLQHTSANHAHAHARAHTHTHTHTRTHAHAYTCAHYRALFGPHSSARGATRSLDLSGNMLLDASGSI
eukprot:1157771-Pelagomonas_calceolata.AAC.4